MCHAPQTGLLITLAETEGNVWLWLFRGNKANTHITLENHMARINKLAGAEMAPFSFPAPGRHSANSLVFAALNWQPAWWGGEDRLQRVFGCFPSAVKQQQRRWQHCCCPDCCCFADMSPVSYQTGNKQKQLTLRLVSVLYDVRLYSEKFGSEGPISDVNAFHCASWETWQRTK